MNFDQIVERYRNYYGLQTDKQLAETLGMAPSNFNRKKKQGLLSRLIIERCEDDPNIDLNWIFYGRKIGEFRIMENKPDQGQALRMLLDIFESDDKQAKEAIYKNLEYFSSAVNRAKGDRRKIVDPDWPPENERRKAGGQIASQG